MPIRAEVDGEIAAATAAGGALDPDQVMIQFVCTTGDGGHDPDVEPDERVRPHHAALHGTTWRLDDMSAPIAPLDFGCFLPGTEVEGVFDSASRAVYHGQAIEIRLKNGAALRITPNHPIATEYGMVPASQVKPGWKLFTNRIQAIAPTLQGVNENEKPACIEKVFHALAERGTIGTTDRRIDDFHGDAGSFNGKIEVVGAYRILSEVRDSQFAQDGGNFPLARGTTSSRVPGMSLGDQSLHGRGPTAQADAGSDMGGGDLVQTLRPGHALPLHVLRLRLISQLDASGQQSTRDDSPIEVESFGYRIDGLPLAIRRGNGGRINWGQMRCLHFGEGSHPTSCLYEPDANGLSLNPEFCSQLASRHTGQVQFDEVAEVRGFDYSGYVYDLRSPVGYVLADGIVAGNCRCAIRYVTKPGTEAAALLGAKAVVDAPAEADHKEAFAGWLDDNVPEWKKIAQAGADAQPQERLQAAYKVARALGVPNARDVARMAVEASPYPAEPLRPMGVGRLAGVGAAGRRLVARMNAGDAEAAAKLAKSYPATFARIVAERGSKPTPKPPASIPKPPDPVPAPTSPAPPAPTPAPAPADLRTKTTAAVDRIQKVTADSRDQLESLEKGLEDADAKWTSAWKAYDPKKPETLSAWTVVADARDEAKKRLLAVRGGVTSAIHAELRVDDPADIQFKAITPKVGMAARANRGLDFLKSIVPRGVIDDAKFFLQEDETGRAGFLFGTVYMGELSDEKTAVHEFAHGLEYWNPKILAAAKALRARRTAGKPLLKLSKLIPGSNYDDDEVARDGGFPSHYCGKVYPADDATELLSMGCQYLYEDPAKFMRQDPEYFRFVVDAIRGL